jgi:hypothetical protein
MRRVWCVWCLRNSDVNTFLIAYVVTLACVYCCSNSIRARAQERSVFNCERKPGNFVTTFYVKALIRYEPLYDVFCGRSACGRALLARIVSFAHRTALEECAAGAQPVLDGRAVLMYDFLWED